MNKRKNQETFGQTIRKKRLEKEYTQRELSKIIGINFTYLSKLENDNADYPPSEKVIKSLAENLDLDFEQLEHKSGKISAEDWDVFRELIKEYQEMPIFLRRMKNNPEFALENFESLKINKNYE